MAVCLGDTRGRQAQSGRNGGTVFILRGGRPVHMGWAGGGGTRVARF